jgi:hypothetical protein
MRAVPRLAIVVAAFALGASGPASAEDAPKPPDPFAAVRFLAGEWQGSATGEAGEGRVSRSYAFVLHGRFLQERSTTTYPPQPANARGEVHEQQSFISYDRQRARLVLRQFHGESFVNTYALDPASTPERLVFVSEDFENFDDAWRAREVYERISNDELVETFELAPPGKPFALYSRARLVRVTP